MSDARPDWHPIVMELAIAVVTRDDAGAFVFIEGGADAIEAALGELTDERSYVWAARDLGAFSAYLRSQASSSIADEICALLSRSVQRREAGHRNVALERVAAMGALSAQLADVVGREKERREDLLKPIPPDAVRPDVFHIPRKV